MMDVQEAIDTARHEFRSEWGDLEHTVEASLWEDGDWQVEAYHSAGEHTVAPGWTVVRRLSTLIEPDAPVEHKEYMWRPDDIQEVVERRSGA